MLKFSWHSFTDRAMPVHQGLGSLRGGGMRKSEKIWWDDERFLMRALEINSVLLLL